MAIWLAVVGEMEMRLEKRDVTLNEKDTLLDMALFEECLQERYRQAADCAESKEEKCVLTQMADELGERIGKLYELLQREPKM